MTLCGVDIGPGMWTCGREQDHPGPCRPAHDHVRVECTDCRAVIYRSSEIKGETHRGHAKRKGVRLAQEHAAAFTHVVEVSGTEENHVVLVVACRCVKCQKAMPGDATGICNDCFASRRRM